MAAGYLLDTSVISETRKRRPDQHVIDFLGRTDSSALFISVLTLGELRQGVAGLLGRDPESAQKLASWLDGLEYSFADRILSVDGTVARMWGELAAQRKRPVIDTLIAATALRHDLTVVTRNQPDFADTAVRILNPWDQQAAKG